MWYYGLVQECIMNIEWIKKNGEHWAAGRVECYDSENRAPWSSHEWGLVIHGKDWGSFDEYLRKNPSDELLSLDKLIENSKLDIVKFKDDENAD